MTDAATLTRTLRGKWRKHYGSAPCPVCQPERRKGQNALTLADGRDGRLLLNCKKSACDFADILAAAGIRSGDYRPPDPAIIAQREREERAQAEKRARQARAVWDEALPIGGTIAETYLRGRGITCDLPGTLRYHPSCWHASAQRLPALVALIEGADGFAVHRTYLRADGNGKAGLEGGDKLMLGSTQGGAVRFASGPGPLLIGEGIESTASAFILHGDPTANAWAALSTSGLRGLRLPRFGAFGKLGSGRASLIVAVDGEKAGRNAGREIAERAAGLGWQVSIADPGDGSDFNDRLIGEGRAA
jgi:hypothetical protein